MNWLESSVLAKWLARKPNHGEGIVSTKPRLKSVYDYLGLLYCFICSIVCLSCPPALRDIFYTLVALYSLFVVKVLLNNNKPNQTYIAWAMYVCYDQ